MVAEAEEDAGGEADVVLVLVDVVIEGGDEVVGFDEAEGQPGAEVVFEAAAEGGSEDGR